MAHYGDDGYLLPDDDEIQLECENCGCEFIDYKYKHFDDDGFITSPFYCEDCEYKMKGDDDD